MVNVDTHQIYEELSSLSGLCIWCLFGWGPTWVQLSSLAWPPGCAILGLPLAVEHSWGWGLGSKDSNISFITLFIYLFLGLVWSYFSSWLLWFGCGSVTSLRDGVRGLSPWEAAIPSFLDKSSLALHSRLSELCLLGKSPEEATAAASLSSQGPKRSKGQEAFSSDRYPSQWGPTKKSLSLPWPLNLTFCHRL